MKLLKKSLSTLTALLMLCCILPFQAFALGSSEVKPCDEPGIWDGSIAAAFAGGSGTENDPYLISNGAELAYLAQQVNGGNPYDGMYFEMMADIYLNDTEGWGNWETNPPANSWDPIGNTPSTSFNGNFNGNGFAVFGVYICMPAMPFGMFRALFGMCGAAGRIENLGLEDSYIQGTMNTGGIAAGSMGVIDNCYNTGTVKGCVNIAGIVAVVNYSSVTNCYNTGTIIGSTDDSNYAQAAGIVADNEHGTISGCHNSGNISGCRSVGGVVGLNNYGEVSNCYNSGNIEGTIMSAGGVAADNLHSTAIKCYNSGNVSGNDRVGGIAGNSSISTLGYSFNTGNIDGVTKVGGVLGFNHTTNNNPAESVIHDCYNVGTVSGTDTVGGVLGSNLEIFYNEGGDNPDFPAVHKGVMNNCYNVGNVAGETQVGAVLGKNTDTDKSGQEYEGTVENCYYLDSCDNDVLIGTPLTDAQLRAAENYVGFDFETVWTMEGNPDYPYAELDENNHVGEWVEPEPSINSGDYDCDGDVDIEDVILTLRAAMKLITPSEQSIINADMNSDGKLTAADALTILRITMGLV